QDMAGQRLFDGGRTPHRLVRRGGVEAASDTGDYDKHPDRRGLRPATDRGVFTDIGPDRGDARAGRRDGAANDVDGFGIQELIWLPPGPTGRAACHRMS